jgi:RNA-directed DNA polymerase
MQHSCIRKASFPALVDAKRKAEFEEAGAISNEARQYSFKHYCSTKKDGTGFQLGRKTDRKRMRAKLREIKETLRQHRHKSVAEQGRWLGTVMKGYFAYFAVPTNSPALNAFRWHVIVRWLRSLRRRSQRHRLTWKRMFGYVNRYLPPVCVLHPWPEQRFRVAHSR